MYNFFITLEPKKIIPPFKRAGTHVAIAYYIYVSKNKTISREDEFYNDPVYKSKLLREQQNFDVILLIHK